MQLRPLQAEKDGSMSHLHIPGGVECLEDIVYKRVHDGAGGFMEMKLDLYRAAGRAPGRAPLLMLVHGGCWCHQTKREGLPAWYIDCLFPRLGGGIPDMYCSLHWSKAA